MIKIYNEDCVKVTRMLQQHSIDCVVTSPPYGGHVHVNEHRQNTYDVYRDEIDVPTYNKMCVDLFNGLDDALKKNGVVCWNVSYNKGCSEQLMLMGTCEIRGLRLIVENPWAMQTYLKTGFIKQPSLIDNDRTKRGDYFQKPTAFWFINCEPTHGVTYQKDKEVVRVRDAKPAPRAGLCSEERSMISHDYARNFINDFILGNTSSVVPTQSDLFD